MNDSSHNPKDTPLSSFLSEKQHEKNKRNYDEGIYNQRDAQVRQGFWIEPAEPSSFTLRLKGDSKRPGRECPFQFDGVSAGWYVDDERHGKWTHSYSDGNIVERGSYEKGKKHGEWLVECFEQIERQTWCNGELASERPEDRWLTD